VEAISRAKTNIVDGIKSLSPADSARIAKIDISGMTSLQQFTDVALPGSNIPVNIPLVPTIPLVVQSVEPTIVGPNRPVVAPKVESPKEKLYAEAKPLSKEMGIIDKQIDSDRAQGIDTTALEEKSADLYNQILEINQKLKEIDSPSPDSTLLTEAAKYQNRSFSLHI
jgi:hypothetical protein